MPSVIELKQRSGELYNEVRSALKDCDDGKITHAQLDEIMDKAESEDAEISKGIKAYGRAQKYQAASAEGGGGEDGSPPDPRELQKMQSAKQQLAKKNADQYQQLVQKAKANLASKGDGQGNFHFDIQMKDQGEPHLMGEIAHDETYPTGELGPLDRGEYFYPGAAGPGIVPEFIPGIAEMRWYPNVVADLMPAYPVTSPIVTYTKEVWPAGHQNAGQRGWENLAAPTKEGATKPASESGIDRFTENVGKIANLELVTDEMIQDAAYFWSLVQRRGVMGVTRKEEVELLAGSGLPGVNGLLNRTKFQTGLSYPSGFTAPEQVSPINDLVIGNATGAGAQPDTVSAVTPGRLLAWKTGEDHGLTLAEGLLKALYDIRVNWFFEPDAIVLHPWDWMTIRLAKDGVGNYLGGSFFGTSWGQQVDAGSVGISQNLTLWNKRTITTPVQPQGLGLVGDFTDAAQVLRLGGLRVDLSNQDGFNFRQNLWTMRIEERVGLLVDRPELFELVQFPDYTS